MKRLNSFLISHGASDAAPILQGAGIDNLADLAPLLNDKDLDALGLPSALRQRMLGADEPGAASYSYSSESFFTPPPLPRRQSTASRDLTAWLDAQGLSDAAPELEELGIVRLADLEQ